MSDWVLNLPVPLMTVVVLGVVYILTVGLYLLVTDLAVGERAQAFKAISPGMLPPLAVVVGLLVGFIAAQAWSAAEGATAAVNREASALRAVVILTAGFPGETEGQLRELVRRHIQDAVDQ